uniref:CCHC-type domain-containing protein n=1 Tax=Micrurus spixii TaxID=129469 RepID=A0A2D4LCJ1_9SAUR
MKGGDMLVHLNFMKRTFQELHEKEMIFSELHQVYTILSSLDESYDGYVSSLEVLTKNELTLTDITGRLLEEARRRQDRDQLGEKHPQDESLCSTAYTIRKCFSCGATGLIARFCKNGKQQNTSKH